MLSFSIINYFNPQNILIGLDEEDKQRRDRRIPRIALRMYKPSPFHHFYDSENNQALLYCTGLEHEKFENLLDKFCIRFDNYIFGELPGLIRSKITFNGRPRDLDAIGGLGLVLTRCRTKPYKGVVLKKFSYIFCASMYTIIQIGEVWSKKITVYPYQ